MKGLEAILFVSVVIVLLSISMLTTIINLAIVYKLRLFPNMELITFTNENVLFNSNVDLDSIQLAKSHINGVSSISGDIVLESGTSAINVNEDGIQIYSDNGFEVNSANTGKLIFPIDFGSQLLPPIPSLSLAGGAKDVHKIRSPTNKDLGIFAKEKIKVRGNQGIDIESKTIDMDSSTIFMASINSSIILDAKEGISLRMKSLTRVESDNSESNQQIKQLQYKLCVCGKTGRIFQMKLRHETDGCGDVRFPESPNPCI